MTGTATPPVSGADGPGVECPGGLSTLLRAARARDLLAWGVAEAAQRSATSLVRVPAIYCSEVVDAIEARGIRCQPYDIDLPADGREPAPASLADGAVVVWWHPFGYHWSPGPSLLARPSRVVIDGCHALRTALSVPRQFLCASPAVYSPRKEFGLLEGGLMVQGLGLSLLTEGRQPVADSVSGLDLQHEVDFGREATALAAALLRGLIPVPGPGDRLSHVPLLAEARDQMIARLRRSGIPAWRWLNRLRGVGPEATPRACALDDHLLLVPLPRDQAGLDRVLDVLADNLAGFSAPL